MKEGLLLVDLVVLRHVVAPVRVDGHNGFRSSRACARRRVMWACPPWCAVERLVRQKDDGKEITTSLSALKTRLNLATPEAAGVVLALGVVQRATMSRDGTASSVEVWVTTLRQAA